MAHPPSFLTKLGWPTPGVAQKKLVTHLPTETSYADVDRYIRDHWLTTSRWFRRGTLKAYWPPSNLITSLKNFRIWKRNLRSWRVVSRKRMPSGSLKSLGKSSVGKSVGNASMKNAWEWLQNCKVTLTRLWWGQWPKKKNTRECILVQKKHSSWKREEW